VSRAIFATVAFLAVLVPASVAGAATLEYGGLSSFDYEAAPGEANHLALGYDGSAWTFADIVPITVEDASGGCRQPTPDSAVCPPVPPIPTQSPRIELGDGDDSLAYSGVVPTGYRLEIDLGEGDDLAAGTPGPDEIWGEGGNDTIRGEGGDDRLDGGSGANTMEGGAGNDELLDQGGSGGTLVGGPGKDLLEGGTGETIDSRDHVAEEFVTCAGPPTALRYDAATTARDRNVTDDVQGSIGGSQCFGAGNTGSAEARPVSRHLRFTITRRTRVLKVPFECPRAARFGCSGEATLWIEVPRLVPSFSSQDAAHGAEFFILPGDRLTVPLAGVEAADFISSLRLHGKMAFEWTWQPSRGAERRAAAVEPVTVDGYTARNRGPAHRGGKAA
jgi:hypothetical protein